MLSVSRDFDSVVFQADDFGRESSHNILLSSLELSTFFISSYHQQDIINNIMKLDTVYPLLLTLLVTGVIPRVAPSAVEAKHKSSASTCAKKLGYYYDIHTKTCVKACDIKGNTVILFGETVACDVTKFAPYGSFEATIPQSIVGLTSLTFLDLSGNDIIGTIPKEIGQLTELTGRDSPL